MFVLCSLLNDSNYFWNKCCGLSFLAIFRSVPLLIFLSWSWYQKGKIGLRMRLRNKKMINYHIKRLYKTACYKNVPTFLSFFSHWLLHKCFSLFLSKPLQILDNWYDFIAKLSLYIKMEKIWKIWHTYFAKNV